MAEDVGAVTRASRLLKAPLYTILLDWLSIGNAPKAGGFGNLVVTVLVDVSQLVIITINITEKSLLKYSDNYMNHNDRTVDAALSRSGVSLVVGVFLELPSEG